MENCYQLVPESDSEPLRYEFDPPAFTAWLDRLGDQGYCQILISSLLMLERMVKAPLDGPRRLAILKRLTVMIRDVADDLPRSPVHGRVSREREQTLSLEQRLWCVTYKNLKRTLEVLDRSSRGVVGDLDAARVWLVGEMFLCLGRQIELGALWGKRWPPHTWQELHDLFFYCANRMAASFKPLEPVAAANPGTDPETAYKRLLLIGLCAEQRAGSLLAPDLAVQFADWVRECELQDPASFFGFLGTYLVEVSGDTPPRLVSGALGSVSRAWVLRLPPGLLAALAAAKAARHRFGTE